ncbi:MAG: hypothetical protein GX081_06755 [Firmicutes bacterium]|nr:hypothetical protein [Bacillota bacterium]
MALFRVGWRRSALLFIFLILLMGLFDPIPATAAEPESYLFRFGLGCQGVFPELGYSAVFNFTKHTSIQGLFIYNDYAAIWGGKYIYRFLLRPTHNLYTFGLVGQFAFYDENYILVDTPGFIAGLGLEFTSGSFIANLKYNLEIGYSTAGFPWGPSGPGLVYGGGIHFYFF